ncbi:uncharacterized protein LOC124200128 isoform X2 [Daphnia pulex]|uniref:uncharacterized protein LOC124200128 isoform X2 n=1 Tax=Daphnia pulex TaxID=6669 RepID=UPI001EDFAA80|nr:uncharacterized protein LOC124200128 isoform X2 [Daphnia pulex]
MTSRRSLPSPAFPPLFFYKSRESRATILHIRRDIRMSRILMLLLQQQRIKKMKSTTNVTISTLVMLVAIMATELLGHPATTTTTTGDQNVRHHHHRHQHADPNSGRASRLLYSPRSRSLNNNNVPDMHTALRRLRESQQMAMTERQSNSAAINQNEPQPNEVEGSHASRHEEDENSSAKELCHAKILQKCGSAVIEGFAETDLPLNQKCRIRENFLHCVIKMKRHSCHKRSRDDSLLTDDYIRSLRQQILTLLWSARGCVLGMEIPK